MLVLLQLFKGKTSESNDFPNMNREISEKLAVNLPLGRSSTRIFQRGSEACHRNTRDILLPSPPQHGNFTAWKFSFPSSCSALPPFKCRPVFYPSTTKHDTNFHPNHHCLSTDRNQLSYYPPIYLYFQMNLYNHNLSRKNELFLHETFPIFSLFLPLNFNSCYYKNKF